MHLTLKVNDDFMTQKSPTLQKYPLKREKYRLCYSFFSNSTNKGFLLALERIFSEVVLQ